jgi:hypothetical protein
MWKFGVFDQNDHSGLPLQPNMKIDERLPSFTTA